VLAWDRGAGVNPAVPFAGVVRNFAAALTAARTCSRSQFFLSVVAGPVHWSQLIEQIATKTELAKRDVKGVMETLAEIGYKELKKNGAFVVPGFAKFVVIKKPATKARNGTNPFTGEPMTFKAKPARKIVRARPVKAAKEAV